jgi:hypothetical protein
MLETISKVVTSTATNPTVKRVATTVGSVVVALVIIDAYDAIKKKLVKSSK